MRIGQKLMHFGLVVMLTVGWAAWTPAMSHHHVAAKDVPQATLRVGINGGACAYATIQAAVNAASSGDTIQVMEGTFSELVTITSKDLTIIGGYNAACTTPVAYAISTVNGGGAGSALTVSGSAVTLRNFDITNGNSAMGGGIRVVSNSNVILENSGVEGNRASSGGGVYIGSGSEVSLRDFSGIADNEATVAGGGARVYGRLVGNDGTAYVNFNSAPSGGGVSVVGGELELTGSNINHNTATAADGHGGGIEVSNAGIVTVIDSSTIASNVAYNGAGIYADGATVTLNGMFYSNSASNSGGGVYLANNAELTATSTYIGYNDTNYENKAVNGGGMYVESGTVNFTGTIVNNQATANGGGIYILAGTITLTDSILQENTSDVDGGAVYIAGGFLFINGQWEIFDNQAGGNGGAVAVAGAGRANLVASGGASRLETNHADGHGGAVYLNNNQTVQIHADGGYPLNLTENSAGANGGALYANNEGFFDTYGQVVFSGNSAPMGQGGGVYLSGGSRIWLDDYESTGPTMYSNWALNGGAIYAVDSPKVECDGAIFGAPLAGNAATSGSGGAIFVSSSTLDADNCDFLYNQAAENGGAIAALTSTVKIVATYEEGAVIITAMRQDITPDAATILSTACDPLSDECSGLFNNTADSDGNTTGHGGAIYSNGSNLTVSQTYLHHNAAYRGGAIYQIGTASVANVSNCLIHHNSVTIASGAGIRRSEGIFNIYHTTLADNVGGSGFSGQANIAYNSIAWGNTTDGFSAVPVESACNIDDGGLAGVNVDPEFVVPGADYHLKSTSPAIDACSTGLPTDLEGNTRPVNGWYDIGAYERLHSTYLPLILR
ncbi:MAG: hypothetical protein JW987_12725 [Anaerolineaceae bacterium]|nr:hypothetical protein [Anaerolineaceae bacterium]